MSHTKKDDLPAMPFYVGDWLKAPDIQCLTYELKGIWFEMLCFMWESKERGVLLYAKDELSRLLRLPEDLLEQKLKQLLEKGIYSVRENDGAIFSRRMIKDQNIREIRIKAGRSGGFATQFAKAKVLANCESENEYEIETNNTTKKNNKEPKIKHLEHVYLSKTQYDQLVSKLGEAGLNSYIDKLNNYLGSTGKKYKSHYHTILTWFNKDDVANKAFALNGIKKPASVHRFKTDCFMCQGTGTMGGGSECYCWK